MKPQRHPLAAVEVATASLPGFDVASAAGLRHAAGLKHPDLEQILPVKRVSLLHAFSTRMTQGCLCIHMWIE